MCWPIHGHQILSPFPIICTKWIKVEEQAKKGSPSCHRLQFVRYGCLMAKCPIVCSGSSSHYRNLQVVGKHVFICFILNDIFLILIF
jgi:hypothetical protein